MFQRSAKMVLLLFGLILVLVLIVVFLACKRSPCRRPRRGRQRQPHCWRNSHAGWPWDRRFL